MKVCEVYIKITIKFEITPIIPDGQPGLMLKVSKLNLTATQHSMGSIPVMVIAESSIIYHSRYIWMVVVVWSVVITVCIYYQSQTLMKHFYNAVW